MSEKPRRANQILNIKKILGFFSFSVNFDRYHNIISVFFKRFFLCSGCPAHDFRDSARNAHI